jgi:hypothetical protein
MLEFSPSGMPILGWMWWAAQQFDVLKAQDWISRREFSKSKKARFFSRYFPTALPNSLKSIGAVLSLDSQEGVNILAVLHHNVKFIEAFTLCFPRHNNS